MMPNGVVIERTALLVTGALLALVSTGALVKLLTSMTFGELETGLSVLAGISLQSGLYLLARQRDLISRGITLVLLLLSVLASTAFVEMSWQRNQQIVTQEHQLQQSESDHAQLLRQQLNTVQQEIDLRMTVADRDTGGSYTTRGLHQLDLLAPLRDQLHRLTQQLQQVHHSDSVAGAASGSVQALLAESHRFTRMSLFAVIAVLIDVVALCCFARRGSVVNQDESLVRQIEIANAVTPVEHIKHRVMRGELGNQPSQRQLIDEVKTAFRELSSEGQLIKSGQGFVFTTDGENNALG